MRSSVILFLAGSLVLVLFVLFSYVVQKDVLTQFDFNMTVRLQDRIPRRVDPIFSWFSTLGNFEVMLVVLGLVLFAIRKLWGGVTAFFLFGVFHLIEIFGKVMVDHPPPPQFMLRTKQLVDFPQYHVRLESSYPSGHSGRTIFVSLLIGFLVSRLRLPLPVKFLTWGGLIGFDVLMLLSRIYLGEHWTTDVVGGALLALSFGLMSLAVYVLPKAKKKRNHPDTL